MPPSSTSSSEPTAPSGLGPWRAAVLALLLGLLCLIAADFGLRWLVPFELHEDWEHQQVAYKEARFKQFARKKRVDVILAGSSVIMDLDAKRLSRAVRGSVFNGGIGSGNPTAMGAILEHMYFAIEKPKLVVYGVSARDLRDTGDPYDQPPFYSHRMRAVRAKNWQERLEVRVERFSYMFRVRRQLRDLAQRGELARGTEIKTDEYGSRPHKTHRLVSSLKGKHEFPADYAYRSRYRNYRIDLETGHAHQLVTLIRKNRERGIRTILVNVPLSPAAMTLFDRREADYRLYLRSLREVARRAGVELHDAHSELALGNRDFYDADHMGSRGDRALEGYIEPLIQRELGR